MSRALGLFGAVVLALAFAGTASASSGALRTTGGPGLAYVTGNSDSASTVWLAAADGTSRRRIGAGSQPLLSPDGRLLATSTTSHRGPTLTLYTAGGSVRRRFFDITRATATAQAFSADSRYLAVVLASVDPASNRASGLAVIDTTSDSYRIVARGSIYGAGFAPDGSDRLVYASAPSASLTASVNVHMVGADGSRRAQLTHDGRSLNPVWGPAGIAFDHERLRIRAEPAFQLWLMRPDGTGRAQLTHLVIPPLRDGLVPLAFSQDGGRLLAEYEGQDTSQAWTLDVARGRLRELMIGGHSVSGAAISRSGTAVLVDRGGFLNPPDSGAIEAMPFTGGRAHRLVAHGSQPSWNL